MEKKWESKDNETLTPGPQEPVCRYCMTVHIWWTQEDKQFDEIEKSLGHSKKETVLRVELMQRANNHNLPTQLLNIRADAES